MNKVMLIYPPGKQYQRGEDRAQCNIDDSAVTTPHACNDIGYAAAVLRQRSYDVFLRDYQTEHSTNEIVKEDILSYKPDAIIISVTNATIFSDIDFVNWITSFFPCKIILKGAIFFNTEEGLLSLLDLSNVDYLVGGEIDVIIGDLIDFAVKGSGDVLRIPGIFYKQKDKFKKTTFNIWFDDLDSIPFPARDLMRNDLYVRPDTGEPMATIQVARGCPAQCTYCLTPIISGRAVRKRSVDNIFREIEECYYKYGIKNFFFKADTFTIDAQWAESLCDKIIESELCGKIQFTVNSRSKPLETSLLLKLKKAGCFMFAIGFESSGNYTLAKIKKGTTAEDNLRAAKLVKEAQLPLLGFFMIGFPWEKKEDIIDTLQFIFQIDPDFIEIHVALPYFGTEFFEECKNHKTIKEIAWGNDYFSPNTIGTQTVPLEEVIALKKKYLMKFYLRPKYIIKKFVSALKKPIICINYIRYGLRLLKNIFSK